ncbi:FlgB family protein [Profundibacter sp.]
MFKNLEIFQMAGAMARHAETRQAMVAQNVANADTPGYKARDIASFAETYRTQDASSMRATRAGHLTGSTQSYDTRIIAGAGSESPNGNNVSLETEMVKAASVRQEHDQALAIYQASLGILRSSLGRR